MRWELMPRMQPNGFSFDAAGLGPFATISPGGRRRRMLVSENFQPFKVMHESWLKTNPARLNQYELSCTPVRFGQTRVCVRRSQAGEIMSVVACKMSGSCFHRFDHNGLRYEIRYGQTELHQWAEIEMLTVALFDELTLQ